MCWLEFPRASSSYITSAITNPPGAWVEAGLVVVHTTYGLQGKTHESGVLAAELVPATAFNSQPNWNPKWVIVEAFAPAWAVGIAVAAAGAATVAFTAAVGWDGCAIAPNGGGPLISLSTGWRLCWTVGVGITAIAFVFL